VTLKLQTPNKIKDEREQELGFLRDRALEGVIKTNKQQTNRQEARDNIGFVLHF